MQSLPMSTETAIAVIRMFEHTYRDRDGVYVNRFGMEAPDLTLKLVKQARQVLA
jgi:hypothetical protein